MTCQGNDRAPIFLNDSDRTYFFGLFERYLGREPTLDSYGRSYANLRDQVNVHSVSTMTNHYHVTCQQAVEGGVTNLFRRVQTSYARYFNAEHGGVGPVFRSRFTATPILSDGHLQRAILYTHLQDTNDQFDYPFSTHHAYIGRAELDYLSLDQAMEVFGGRVRYVKAANEQGPEILKGKLEEMGMSLDERPFRPVLWTPGGSEDEELSLAGTELVVP